MIDKKIREWIRRLRFGAKASSESYVEFLRKKGMKIGEDVIIYSPLKTLIDLQYPWEISIGNHVRIATGTIILTHDFSWSVLKRLDGGNGSGAVLGASGYVNIGNNVFIGMNAIILRNVRVGDNAIIGAGSVVTSDCESGYVYAGNPAKKIMSVEEYYKKRCSAQKREAKQLVVDFYQRYNKIPPKEIFNEYFMLFESGENLPKQFEKQMNLCNNYEESVAYIKNNKAEFCGYDDFIQYCFDERKDALHR